MKFALFFAFFISIGSFGESQSAVFSVILPDGGLFEISLNGVIKRCHDEQCQEWDIVENIGELEGALKGEWIDFEQALWDVFDFSSEYVTKSDLTEVNCDCVLKGERVLYMGRVSGVGVLSFSQAMEDAHSACGVYKKSFPGMDEVFLSDCQMDGDEIDDEDGDESGGS